MIPTAKIIQCQELAGLPYMGPGHRNKATLPFGELYVDDAGNPVAVVCHLKKVVEVTGLVIAAITDGPGGTKEVTYVTNPHQVRPGVGRA